MSGYDELTIGMDSELLAIYRGGIIPVREEIAFNASTDGVDCLTSATQKPCYGDAALPRARYRLPAPMDLAASSCFDYFTTASTPKASGAPQHDRGYGLFKICRRPTRRATRLPNLCRWHTQSGLAWRYLRQRSSEEQVMMPTDEFSTRRSIGLGMLRDANRVSLYGMRRIGASTHLMLVVLRLCWDDAYQYSGDKEPQWATIRIPI